MPPKSKLKKGKNAKNSRAVNNDSVTSEDETPPPSRSTSRAAKKRRAAKKVAAPPEDASSTDEGPDVHESLQSMTALMTVMSARLDGIEEGGRTRRRVSFLDDLPPPEEEPAPVIEDSRSANPGARSSSLAPQPFAQPRLPTDVFSAARPHVAPKEQLPGPSAMSALPTTVDVSDAVRERVALRLQAAPAPIFLSDEEFDIEGMGARRSNSKSVRSVLKTHTLSGG